MMTINNMTEEIHANAIAHGWWDEPRSFGEILALCHSELSEALEEDRADRPMVYFPCIAEEGEPCQGINCDYFSSFDGNCNNGCLSAKPEGVAVEMADCIIRILDWAGHAGVDMEQIILKKHEYNKSRPYKHGKKY